MARKNGADQREAHPAAVAYERRQKRNRRLDMAKTAAPIVVFALIAVGYVTLHGKHGNTGSAAMAPNMSATSTSSCFAGEAGCGSMSAPYADSPAAAWADGAAGIVLPAVTAVGGFSAEAVSSDLALSKQFATDQSLIPAVLDQGATPTAMLSLLTPSSNFSGKVVSEIAVATQTDDPTNVFVRFDPKTAVLLATPKVSGTVTAGGGDQPLSGTPVDPYATATAGPVPTVTSTSGGCQPVSRI